MMQFMKTIKELTKAEEEVMQIIWKLKQGFANDIVSALQDSVTDVKKPAYNTILTIVRILEKKGFVGHETFGKSNRYFPLIFKDEYSSYFLNSFVKNYFNNSYGSFISCFANRENLSIKEIEELKSLLQKQIEESEK
jgi:BlaI family transcriptional regulator, penicillinase repressor